MTETPHHVHSFTADGETPWEPPFAGTEAEALLGALDRMRWTFRYKADGLDSEGLAVTIGASTLTLGGLLKHLAAGEDTTLGTKLDGTPLGEPWTKWGWDGTNDWDFTSAASDPPDLLYRTYDDAVARTRARVAALLEKGGMDQRVHVAAGAANLRRLVCDMLEEYGRHTGHADLLREAVDGRTGEDPPAGWRPAS